MITIDESTGIVTKRVSNDALDWLGEHFDYYKQYQKFNPRAVKVYDRVGTDSYTMEYIRNVGTLSDWLAERNLKEISLTKHIKDKALEVFVNHYEKGTELFSRTIPGNDKLFINIDVKLSNILVTHYEEFKMIDPESWYVKTVHPDEMWRQKLLCQTRINEVMNTMTNMFRGD